MKKKSILILILIIFSTLILTFTACFGNKEDIKYEMPTYESYATGFSYVSNDVVSYVDIDKEVPSDIRDTQLELNEDYDITYRKIKANSSYEDLCAMGADDAMLYTGALIDVKDDAFSPIVVDRAPITISANLESMLNNTAPLSVVVDKPNTSTVREGIRNIVSANISGKGEDLPSNISMEIKEINNQDEFLMNLGFGLQVSKFSLSENFTYSNIKKQTNLAIVLKQVYYTVDMDHMDVRDLFAQNLTNEEINKKLDGTIPAYVSSVSYGRIAVISIQTNYSKDEITNALNIAWGNMSGNPGSTAKKKLSIEFDSTLKNIATDTETDVQYFVYGGGSGSQDSSASITSNSNDAISSIFSTFKAAEAVGLPISYKIRTLDGRLHKIQDASEYVIKDINYKPKKIMDWTFLDRLLQGGELFKQDTLKIDLSAMVNYANTEDTNVNATRTIVLPDNIKDFCIVGPNNAANNIKYKDLSIKVAYRGIDNPIKLHLENITFTADSGTTETAGVAIMAEDNAPVILDIKGDVALYGIKEAIKAQDLDIVGSGNLKVFGGMDSSAIACSENLNINMTGTLIINGGNGSDGNATDGICHEGGTGINAKNLTINVKERSKVIVNGGVGGVGLNGKNYENGSKGGTGGIGVCATNIIFTGEDIFVNGGQGGIGGKGGWNGAVWAADYNPKSGGAGGDGGAAIQYAGSIQIDAADNVVGGFGGDGGVGGDWTWRPGGIAEEFVANAGEKGASGQSGVTIKKK